MCIPDKWPTRDMPNRQVGIFTGMFDSKYNRAETQKKNDDETERKVGMGEGKGALCSIVRKFYDRLDAGGLLVDSVGTKPMHDTWGTETGEHRLCLGDIFRVSALVFLFHHKLNGGADTLDFHVTGGNIPGEQAIFLHGELGHLQQLAMKQRGRVFHFQQPHELLRKARLNIPGTVGSSLLDNFFRTLDLSPEVMKPSRRALKVDSARDGSANDNREKCVAYYVVWDQGERCHEN
ncbi:hypothetical protein B0H11DRAFT_2095800 [Mycena galericulata]|nr:hypothetical protein B0H11DRAFT_2095800 [Mycena galericulata]